MAEQRSALSPLAVAQRWMEIAPSGDWVTGLRDEARIARMRAFMEEHAAPDVEVEGIGADAIRLTPALEGAVGLLEFWRDWLEPWESFYVDVEEIREGSEGVMIEAVQRGRLRGSAAEVNTPSAAVLLFRRGVLRRIEFHLDRERAGKTAGL
jgi:hypothetical protein